jgi:hypothetical protein
LIFMHDAETGAANLSKSSFHAFAVIGRANSIDRNWIIRYIDIEKNHVDYLKERARIVPWGKRKYRIRQYPN